MTSSSSNDTIHSYVTNVDDWLQVSKKDKQCPRSTLFQIYCKTHVVNQ